MGRRAGAVVARLPVRDKKIVFIQRFASDGN
jgi:hypothetical protein